MRRYRISYRVVPNSHPRMSIILTYVIETIGISPRAENIAYDMMMMDIQHLQGYWNEDELKRTTIMREK